MKKILMMLLFIPMIAHADIIVVVKDNYRAPSEVVVFNGVCLASALTRRFPDASEGGHIDCYSKDLILYKQIKCVNRTIDFWTSTKKMECK